MRTTPNLEEVSEMLRQQLPRGYSAILFGSRATGSARAASDWDIGILGPTPLEGALIQRIREMLEELPTLHSFDVVDLLTVPEGFQNAALQHSVRLV